MLPVLFDSSYFVLYAYPLFMGLAWGFSYFFTQYLFEKDKIPTSNFNFLYLGCFLSSFVGAKLFFLWFSSGNKFYQYLSANYFWMGGGFVFYGGLIGGLLFYLVYTLVFKKFDFEKSYLLIPGLIWGHAIGRVGCFLAGCCFGSVCDLPWAIRMHDELRHPVQLYEAAILLALGIYILKLINNKRSNFFIINSYIIIYSFSRFILEFARGDLVRGISEFTLSSSQIISILLIVLCLILIFYKRFIRKY